MSDLLLFAQSGGGGQIQEIAQTFGVDGPRLIAQIISFSIVAALLYRFAYHPVLAMLEERRRQIADGLAAAEKNKAELAKAEAERQQVIAQANADANQLIDEARSAAARIREQKVQEAAVEAEQIVAKAREQAKQEHDRMLADLKREVGRLVIETTAVVSGKVLTPEDQQHLAEETAKQLSA